jgi:hypothetical protein
MRKDPPSWQTSALGMLLAFAVLESLVNRVVPAAGFGLRRMAEPGRDLLLQPGLGVFLANLVAVFAAFVLVLAGIGLFRRNLGMGIALVGIGSVGILAPLVLRSQASGFVAVASMGAILVLALGGIGGRKMPAAAGAAVLLFAVSLGYGHASWQAVGAQVGPLTVAADLSLLAALTAAFFAWALPLSSLSRAQLYGAFGVVLAFAGMIGLAGYAGAAWVLAWSGSTLPLPWPMYTLALLLGLVAAFKLVASPTSRAQGLGLLLLLAVGASPGTTQQSLLAVVGVFVLVDAYAPRLRASARVSPSPAS